MDDPKICCVPPTPTVAPTAAAHPDESAAFSNLPLYDDLLQALEHVECVYRLNVVRDSGEPSSTLDNLQRVIARARATAPQATIMKLAESNTDLRAQIERYQAICASAYQLAGVVDAPLRFLDALAAASNGEPVSEEAALDLLPVTVEECAVVPKGATLTDEQIAAIWLSTTGFNECDMAQDVIGFARALLSFHPTKQAGK